MKLIMQFLKSYLPQKTQKKSESQNKFVLELIALAWDFVLSSGNHAKSGIGREMLRLIREEMQLKLGVEKFSLLEALEAMEDGKAVSYSDDCHLVWEYDSDTKKINEIGGNEDKTLESLTIDEFMVQYRSVSEWGMVICGNTTKDD